MWILKIVLVCVAITTIISTVIDTLLFGHYEMLDIGDVSSLFADHLSDVISETIVSLLASFGCVTLVFACLEHQNVKINNKKSKEWAPGSLPPIPNDFCSLHRNCLVLIFLIIRSLLIQFLFLISQNGILFFRSLQLHFA